MFVSANLTSDDFFHDVTFGRSHLYFIFLVKMISADVKCLSFVTTEQTKLRLILSKAN